jgi:anthranilate synthase component 1
VGFLHFGPLKNEKTTMLTPTLEDFLDAEKSGPRPALRRRLPADLDTPVSIYLKLKHKGAVFLLESVEQGIQKGRYSFIGISPYAHLSVRQDQVKLDKDGKTQSFLLGHQDPLELIRTELASLQMQGPDLPGPFGGAVGYLSHELVAHFEGIPVPAADPLDLPDLAFLFPQAVVVIDHVKSELEIFALPRGDDPQKAYEHARHLTDAVHDALISPLNMPQSRAPMPTDPVDADLASLVSNTTPDQFKERVEKAKSHIESGDAFQIVLSQRLEGETQVDGFQIYRCLRILNPSPYLFFVDFGEFQLLGSSPEVLVKLENNQATLCPIAGTRPRGDSPSRDQALEKELLEDDKERAEHVMLVDLGRNDLGRVCAPGSVKVDSLMHVERYSHVMHLVSTLRGTLAQGKDGFDLARAAFPAGTLTGAPKIRAMQIIAELEGERRGPYGGALGYFSSHGHLDLCITIRTLVMKGQRYFLQGGAGIVADSDPQAEYEESLNKIKALHQAVRLAEGGV